MKGSYYQAQLAAEKKKCKAKKSKKARASCIKGASAKASKSAKKAMKGTERFYGFRLKANQIPASNGTLIWAERQNVVTTSPVGQAVSQVYNVLYSSKSYPGDRKAVVSGTVMLPKGKPPRGGWPVISWAHGTVGLADQCAPSRNLRTEQYYEAESGQLIADWLKEGWAVAATDYEGLGTRGVHPYLIGNSEGRGVLDIVSAARQLDGRLSKRAVITGHSQGGQAALFAANLATTKWRKDTSYLGTVSYAPVSNLDVQAPNIGTFDGQPGQYGISALALSILRGAVAGNPSIKPSGILTEAALAQYPKTETLCYSGLSEAVATAGLRPGQILQSGWRSSSDGLRFNAQLKAMNPALKVGAPVLIPQGDADGTVIPDITDILIGQLNTLNPQAGRISYEMFPGADHSGILLAAEGSVAPFINGLFNP